MNVRFVGDQEQDPAVLHRRHLQAKRTQNYRQRKNANQDIKATDDLAELLPHTVESGPEIGQTGPEDSSLADTGEFRQDEISSGDVFITPNQESDDSGIDAIEPAYYDEEPVSVYYTEEREDPTECQSPECYVEVQADLPDDNTWTDLQHTTQKFIQQFLVGIYGCSAQEHREALAVHIEAEGGYL
ncbi:hypothetical protein EDB81DRAFT_829410 [Dactylonectria macrodidyma]|uniref:Uncharacterized protein n=1 Tax=Dactylonectria macrodidyma TaxID=307937 RepID=A0A9P9D192_9HYPO|nr:hypothetical protein EDB81DRAFT_829410 [Dactylonectria macrodidyma]